MLFSSMIFLWLFFPFVIIGNVFLSWVPCLTNRGRIKCKNRFLLICSLFFYAWGGIYYVLIMLGVILIDFAGARWMSSKKGKGRKHILVTVVFANFLVLFFFKYFNMMAAMAETIIAACSGELQGDFFSALFTMQGTGSFRLPHIVLPIGISFFIFQAVSYVIDVYRGEKPQTDILDFALYISLFPQLIAGPIVQYSDISRQLMSRAETSESFLYGVKRFCLGMGKKVLIANTLGNVADQIWGVEISQLGAGMAWLGIISYTFQIYYDFSGYSDMAIGIGSMLGFQWKENFNYPYTALSVQDIWRRWHISLSSWFKNYVYIPLGGSRRGKAVTCRNLLIVFLLTGIWHGANYTFLFWGLFQGMMVITERLFLGKILRKNPLKFLNWIYTMFVFIIGWIFFRSDNVLIAVQYMRRLFYTEQSADSVLTYLSMQVILALLFGILGMGFIQKYAKKIPRIENSFVFQMAVLVVSILHIAAGTYNPFIYFQF